MAVFVPFDTGGDHFFWGPLFDAGHYPLFFLVTLFLYLFGPISVSRLPHWSNNPYFIAMLLVLGIEVIQPLFDRDASLPDTLNGLLGIAAAGVFIETRNRDRSILAQIGTIAALCGIFVALLVPIIPAKKSIDWRAKHFPVLARFSAPEERLLWKAIRPHEKSQVAPAKTKHSTFEGRPVLEVQTKSGDWSGVRYAAGDLSWQNYSHLSVRITNPSEEPFTLHVRIDDNEECKKFHQRYNNSVQLSPGRNELQLTIDDIRNGPRDRELNISRIRSVLFFTDKRDRKRRFLLQGAQLVLGR